MTQKGVAYYRPIKVFSSSCALLAMFWTLPRLKILSHVWWNRAILK